MVIIVGEGRTSGRCILAAEDSGRYKKEEEWTTLDRYF
jgi:hypothetical protein